MTKQKKLEMTPDEKLAIEIETERRAKALENYLKTSGHGLPKTRREFLASGVLGMSGFVVAPTVLSVLSQELSADAQSSGCGSNQPSSMFPFVTVNLGGGAALHANVVPHDVNRQPLLSYTNIGLGLPANFNIIREFGNTPFPVTLGGVLVSKFLEGMRVGAANPAAGNAPTSFARTAFLPCYIRSQDDNSQDNKHTYFGLVQAAGGRGTDLPLLGTAASPTGVGQNYAGPRPSAPLRVGSFGDIAGALGPSGNLGTQLAAPAQRTSLLNLIKSLSDSQKRRLASTATGQTLGQLMQCATGKNAELSTGSSAAFDPRLDANLAGVWGITAATAPNNQAVVQASLIYNALNGKAAACGISMGGYDYHNNPRTTTDQRDLEAGTLVGRILRSAEVMNRPVVIDVVSDGSVSHTNSNLPDGSPSGDSGSRGCTYMIVFNPAGRPATNDFQIGEFTNAQSAADNTIQNWSVERAAMARFANYLAVQGKLSMLEQILPGQFAVSDLNKILKFG